MKWPMVIVALTASAAHAGFPYVSNGDTIGFGERVSVCFITGVQRGEFETAAPFIVMAKSVNADARLIVRRMIATPQQVWVNRDWRDNTPEHVAMIAERGDMRRDSDAAVVIEAQPNSAYCAIATSKTPGHVTVEAVPYYREPIK